VRAYQRALRALYIWITAAGHATPSDAERPCRGKRANAGSRCALPEEFDEGVTVFTKTKKTGAPLRATAWAARQEGGDLTKMARNDHTFAKISDEIMTGGSLVLVVRRAARPVSSFPFVASRPVQPSNRSFFSVREANSIILPIFPGAFLGAELRTPSVAR
jgi:hypothetical protein